MHQKDGYRVYKRLYASFLLREILDDIEIKEIILNYKSLA